jgi:phosphohistidine swiveling domain-containing protein
MDKESIMVIKKTVYRWYMLAIMSLLGFSTISTQIIAHNEKNALVTGRTVGFSVVAGVARVITTSGQLSKVSKGDIIVASTTDYSWEPVMRLAGGIITDQGDEHCHAALFGKKMDIPVVVGAGNATQKIVDGQYIIIDCAKNTVYDGSDVVDQDLVSHQAARTSGVPFPADTSSGSSSHTSGYSSRTFVPQDQITAQTTRKHVHDAKTLYSRHYFSFEKYVLSMRDQVWWGRKTRTVEIGARAWGCNDFAMKCIDFVYPFFDRNEKYIVETLKSIGRKEYQHIMETLVVRCSERPGDLNWVAQVSHEEHVNHITLPSGVEREWLKREPREYKKIVDQNKVSVAECHALIATGLFARYLVEKKLI